MLNCLRIAEKLCHAWEVIADLQLESADTAQATLQEQLASEQAAHATTQEQLASEEGAHRTLQKKHNHQFIWVYHSGKVEVKVGAPQPLCLCH